MTITLYQIYDDAKNVNKTVDNTTKITELTATLKGDCSVEEPTLEIEYSASYINANYVYISDWGRYYFIKSKTVGTYKRIYLELSEDVLYTYKTGILNMVCLVERVQNQKDAAMLMVDKAFKALGRHLISTRKFPYKFTKKDPSIIMTTGGRS